VGPSVAEGESEVETSIGSTPVLKSAGTADGIELRMDSIPDVVDQHGEAILKESGIVR
jgi:hypothetical protein